MCSLKREHCWVFKTRPMGKSEISVNGLFLQNYQQVSKKLQPNVNTVTICSVLGLFVIVYF